MHDLMNIALVDASLIVALPLVLIAVLNWSDKRKKRRSTNGTVRRRRRIRRLKRRRGA
jgi:hypothetical protein